MQTAQSMSSSGSPTFRQRVGIRIRAFRAALNNLKVTQLSRFLMFLLAEIIGGSVAWHIAKTLWFHSLQYSQAHMEMFVNSQNMCHITHQRDFIFALAFEVTGCFVIRLVLPRLPSNIGRYLAPAFIASLFSFAILFIGDAGLDPIVASSLFFGCSGLTAQWFILLYWVSISARFFFVVLCTLHL
ncbi:hypothetical protein COOONC_11262 [Cooperia oncophora]